MAKRKKSSNKIIPVVALAAIIVGGYYWLKSDDSPIDGLDIPGIFATDSTEVTDTSADSTVDELLSIEGDSVLADSILSSAPQNETNVTSEGKAKNAYVDEYGNVIYTQPNGVSPITYKTAKMGRWGYSIKYPTFMTKTNHSSDGSSFEDKRGLKLATYASWNVFNESITDLYHKDFPGTKSVTYKKLFKKQNTYVKSGYTKDNKIYYLKEAIIVKDEQEVVATLIFYYTKSYEKDADKVIKEVFAAFPHK